MQAKDSATENTIRSLHPTRQAQKPQVGQVAVFGASAVASYAAARSCMEEQPADPMNGWQGITERKEATGMAKPKPNRIAATQPIMHSIRRTRHRKTFTAQ
ncbi:MAG: hypothetical protein E2O63_03740 [Gammaproteobacteria bacterium]|nr:MAG: hypothetical protein E2O63_03740 [Gammaproteobacteria bacterium]